MKKILLIILCALMSITFSLNRNIVNAQNDSPSVTSETVSFPDIVIYTAMQAGENWTDYKLVDFGVKHGNVTLGNISKFTTYNKEDGWQGSLGVSGDNAYTQESWKLFTQANDGFIFEFIAKYPVKISIVKEKTGGDWVDATNLNIYKKNDSGLSVIKNVALTESTPASDYGVEVELAKGETLYWEFVFEWTAHRNMINLPKATFTYNEEASSEPEVTPSVPTVSNEAVSFPDMVVYTAMQKGENWTDYKLVDFGVKHGNVTLGNISKFTTYNKEDGWQGSLGASGDNAYTQESWKLFTQANDGFIFEFIAKYPVKISIVKEKTGGDWVDATNLNIYKKSDSGLSVIKNVALTESTPASDYGVEVELAKGETLYWEFIFEWTAHRNMINLPKATFTYIEPHICDFGGNLFFNENYHWYECSCGKTSEKLAHKGGVATETEQAKCEVCGTSYGDLINHTHTYDESFSYDDEYHWHQANCEHNELKIDTEKHNLTWETIKEATMISSGEELGSCICGYEEKRIIEAVLEFPDYSSLNEIGLNDLAVSVAINNGAPAILDSMEINLLQGNVFANVKGFTNYYIDGGTDDLRVIISDSNEFDGKSAAAFSTWRIKTTSNSSAIFEIKATKDIKLTISHDAFNGGWIDEHGQYFAMYLKVDGKVYTRWSKDIVTEVADANLYGGTVMLKAGDICYYVFGSSIADERNVNIVPTFTADEIQYDEDERNSQMILANETVNMWDALTATINNNYNDASYNLIDFGFYYGSIKNLVLFDYHIGDGSGTADDALWDNVSCNTGFLRWQMQCSAEKNAIMKITAKENVKVTINHSAIWFDAWSTFTSVRYYAQDIEGTKVLLKDIPVSSGTTDDYFSISVNLEKGQVLFIDYYTTNDDWGSLNFAPVVTASTLDFNELDMVDFSAIKALDSLKEQKIKELNDLYDTLDEYDYSISNWGKLENYITDAILIIEEAQTADTINNIVSETIANVDAVKTLVEEKEILDAYKKVKIDELNSIVAGLDQKNYSPENWELITNKVTEITQKINKAITKTSVDTMLANAKTFINNVAVTKQSNGCRGSLIPTTFFTMCLLCLVLVLRKKKIIY